MVDLFLSEFDKDFKYLNEENQEFSTVTHFGWDKEELFSD